MCKNSQKDHINIQLTLLWFCERWVNSKQALWPLHVWNHFVYPFFDRFCATDCQILSQRNLSSLGQIHLMCTNSQKYHKNNKLSCHNLNCFCMYFHQLRTHHRMGLVLVRTTNKGYWRNFGCFRVFAYLLTQYYSRLFWEGHVFGCEIITFLRHAATFFFRISWAWE